MFKDASDLISGFFSGLDIKRRWFFLFVILALILIGSLSYEIYTGYLYYSSLEKKIALLERMDQLSKSGIASNPDLYPIFTQTIKELENKEITPLTLDLTTVISFSPLLFGKIISGSFIGLFFLVLALLGLMPAADSTARKNMIIGAISFAIVGGIIGALIPVIYNEWVNYIGLPLLIFTGMFLYGRKK